MKSHTTSFVTPRATSRHLMLALWFLTASLLPLAGHAENAGDIGQLNKATAFAMPDWQLIEHDNGQAIEVTQKSSGGSVSAVCAGGQCNVFVEPISTCTPQAQYPILLNSPKQVGVIAGVCRTLSSDKGTRRVVHLTDRKAVFAAMLEGEDLSLAYPTTSGAVEVIEVVVAGLRPLLKEAIGRPTPDDDGPSRQAPELIEWVIEQTQTRDNI